MQEQQTLTNSKEEVLRSGKVMEMLGVSAPKLQQMISDKVIPVHRIGNIRFFIASEIIDSIKKVS